jgi:chromosome segregation ATPase
MQTNKEKLAVALSNVAELKNKLADVRGFTAACESLVATLNLITSDVSNELNAQLSEKEYLDSQLSTLKLNVKKEADKLETLKKSGDSFLNEQKANFDNICKAEVNRLEAKEKELDVKIKENVDKQNLLNQKIAETEALGETLKTKVTEIDAEHEEVELKLNNLTSREHQVKVDEDYNNEQKSRLSGEVKVIEIERESNKNIFKNIRDEIRANEQLLSDIKKSENNLLALIGESDLKLKTIEKNKEEILRLEALKIECAKLKKNLDDKDANLTNLQKELEKYASKIGYKK